jgi:hypothetical protein
MIRALRANHSRVNPYLAQFDIANGAYVRIELTYRANASASNHYGGMS